MKIIACIKQVPDSEAKVKAEDGKVSWGESPLVINPFDEYAVEGALQQKEAQSGTVTALCIGPESAKEALKHALAMGADDAILISDPALDAERLDTLGAARVLAAAIQKIGGVDMVVFGRQTLDNGAGITPAQTARLLGWPMLGLSGQIKVQDGSVSVERVIEEGRQTVSAKLPAVLSVVQSIGEPRYPSFMGIRKASKANIPVWSLSDVGASAPEAIVKRTELTSPPARETDGRDHHRRKPGGDRRKAGGQNPGGEGAMKTFVYIDHFKGDVQPASWEALGLAKSLGTASAVVFGSGVDAIVKAAFEYGADEVLVADDAALTDYRAEPYASTLSALASAQSPDLILFPTTARTRELAAMLGVDLNTGVLTDVSALEANGNDITMARARSTKAS